MWQELVNDIGLATRRWWSGTTFIDPWWNNLLRGGIKKWMEFWMLSPENFFVLKIEGERSTCGKPINKQQVLCVGILNGLLWKGLSPGSFSLRHSSLLSCVVLAWAPAVAMPSCPLLKHCGIMTYSKQTSTWLWLCLALCRSVLLCVIILLLTSETGAMSPFHIWQGIWQCWAYCMS